MILTIQIDDNELSFIKDKLRISVEQYQKFNISDMPEVEFDLVYRIMHARKAFGFRMDVVACCHDYKPAIHGEYVG